MFPDLTRDDVYRLETPRLWLRWPRVSDTRCVQVLAGEKAVANMTARIPHPYPSGAAEAVILKARDDNAEGHGLALAITEKGNPSVLIGVVSIFANCDGAAEIGYWLGKPYWGKGYATEAVQAMVDAAFTFAGIDALHASVFLSNTASQQVLEKSGFHFEDVRMCRAPARGGSVHANGYVLTRKTWASLKRWRAPIIEGLQFDVPRPVFPAELAACA